MSESARGGHEFVLTLSCPDRPGIVYAVSGFLVQHQANIIDSQQFGEPNGELFFMRVYFRVPPPGAALADLERGFSRVARSFSMTWKLNGKSARVRTLLMVSQLGHCLNDLLFRWSAGSLPVDVVGVVSNHEAFRGLTEAYRLPFHYLPVTSDSKPAAEAGLLSLIDETRAELVVLARYMQIVSPEVCKRMEGRMINIHHSFLPSFKGARPYHQAYAKGVKLVGATAHYVTPDLDEGPIIEQDLMRVDHSFGPDQLVEAGRDVETQVLARAVRWHAEHRILLNGNRTVILLLSPGGRPPYPPMRRLPARWKATVPGREPARTPGDSISRGDDTVPPGSQAAPSGSAPAPTAVASGSGCRTRKMVDILPYPGTEEYPPSPGTAGSRSDPGSLAASRSSNVPGMPAYARARI